MRELIEKKIDGQEISAPVAAPAGQVIDILAALKASLGGAATSAPAIAAPAPAVEPAAKARRAPKKAG
jgi:non-homologous end joining protein Ku